MRYFAADTVKTGKFSPCLVQAAILILSPLAFPQNTCYLGPWEAERSSVLYMQWFSTEDTRGVLKSLILSADVGSLGSPRVLQAELFPLQEQFQVTFFFA